MIFVFGSNESGIHGGGAAKVARDSYGAIWGVGFGRHGNSFAIPTKSWGIEETLPLPVIRHYVDAFKRYASFAPVTEFKVTQLGCGLAGLKARDIAPMFGNYILDFLEEVIYY